MASTLDRVLTISLVLSLVLLMVLLAITLTWRVNRGTNMAAAEQQICQPCSELRINKQLPDGCRVLKTKSADAGKCCCKGSSVIDTVIKTHTKILYDNFTANATVDVLRTTCTDGTKTKGKVAGIDYPRLQEETREKDLVYFKKNGHSIIDSLRYNNGRFSIAKPGFYYVFSQLKYSHDSESMNDTNARQSHTLHRYSFRQGKREILLEDTRTFSELHAPLNNGTSFIGAVFDFHDSDQIMIKCTHTHMLSGDDRENFFSLYKI